MILILCLSVPSFVASTLVYQNCFVMQACSAACCSEVIYLVMVVGGDRSQTMRKKSSLGILEVNSAEIPETDQKWTKDLKDIVGKKFTQSINKWCTTSLAIREMKIKITIDTTAYL